MSSNMQKNDNQLGDEKKTFEEKYKDYAIKEAAKAIAKKDNTDMGIAKDIKEKFDKLRGLYDADGAPLK